MVLEITSKKESTAKGYLAVETMQTHFLNEVLRGGGAMAKPMDNAASLVAMLLWMSRTGRGSQLDSFILSCQGYMAAVQKRRQDDAPPPRKRPRHQSGSERARARGAAPPPVEATV